MQFRASIPKKSASLLLLRPPPPSKISFFDYDILVLRRNTSMTFGSALVFPGGKVQPQIDQLFCNKYGMPSLMESAALRESFEQTGLFFSSKPIVQSDKLAVLEKIRLGYIANVFNGVLKAKEKAYEQLSELLKPTPFMVPFIRMITVPILKHRYDTMFFVLPLKEYKYLNFFKYAEHEKHIHNIEEIDHCRHEYSDFRWMNPAQILHQHFQGKSVVAPPQFIMLNIMMQFTKHRQFVNYLKNLNRGRSHNMNLGPNIISLVPNSGSERSTYPYAATLIGDREFPYEKILEFESSPDLKEEVSRWKGQMGEGQHDVNRFLFKDSKKFFHSEYEVVSRISDSVIGEMRGWQETKEAVANMMI